jgi:hypothetical protein
VCFHIAEGFVVHEGTKTRRKEMKKYSMTNEVIIRYGQTLTRIKAEISFGNVNQGDLGGYVQSGEGDGLGTV